MDATLKSFLAAALYAFISTSITFFNKAVLASYAFGSPNIMTLVQMICSMGFLVVLKWMGAISYPSPSMATARKVLPLSVAFMAMVLTGLGALKYLNIPMFNALRRATTLITMIGESWLLGARNTRIVQLTVWLMIGGAVLAGWFDFDFNAMGYFLVTLNCIATAAYLLYIAQLGKSSGLNTFGLMWYNNAQSIPFVLALCWYNGDFAEVQSYPHLYDWDFMACFIFQSALAFLLNYSIFLCTQVNSALATSVTGQMKNIVTTAVGYFSFGDVTYNAYNVMGLFVGVVASSWYSLLKYWESEANKKQSTLPLTSPRQNEATGHMAQTEEEKQSLLQHVSAAHPHGTTPITRTPRAPGFAMGPAGLITPLSSPPHPAKD